MGAQQVKENRGGASSSSSSAAAAAAAAAANSCNPISSGLSTQQIGPNSTNLSTINCPIANNSAVSGGSTFGAGSSLRASRINKSRVPKESKNVALNVFTEHNGK